MLKQIVSIFMLFLIIGITASCSKKKSGFCYCSYYGGNRTVYDLNGLERQKQVDSCNRLSELASGFAGSCKLKK
ncbi:hypothetical protein [Taibaiella sp. KBW10]|uniref:hypothetical protein n=1 Tax=Taibaiella sp. KBW10 TaxID=2153357 RepID=UPI000F59B87E|nr:hypothetical protein [Taibaiella sp. KBW10]